MSDATAEFDNARVCLSTLEGRGRGLVARKDLVERELIIRSPVKVLNTMEYQVLRFIPSIRSFLARRDNHDGDGGLISLKVGLDHMFNDPDAVLGVTQEAESAGSAIMYTFTWPRSDQDGGDTAAIAFGLTSMCNHAPDAALANAELVRDTDRQHIDLVSLGAIFKGEEILINYASVPFEVM